MSIVTIRSKKEISEFFKQSDKRFNSSRFKGGKDSLTAWINKFGQLQTGLTKEDEERLGKELGKDLSKLSDFWHDYKVTIHGDELVLYTDNPDDELKYLLLKSHYRVQSDPTKPKANADYILESTVDKAKRNVSTASLKIKAFTLYSELTMQEKRDILKLYPGFSQTDNVQDEIIEDNLISQLERNYENFIRKVEDKNRNSKVFVEELVSAKILTKNRNMYKYGDDVLGHNIESTIEHLDNPKNQGLKIALMQELKDTKKSKK